MNTWNTLSKILNNKTLQIAEVIGYNDVYHTVKTSSNSIVDVKSENKYLVGDFVFIENNQITNKAPTLNTFEIELQ